MFSRLWSKRSGKRPGQNTTAREGIDPPTAPEAVLPALPDSSFKRRQSGVTFEVDSVTPARQPMKTGLLGRSLSWRLDRKVLLFGEEQRHTVDCGSHPLIEAVHAAFSQHRPLTLSPDHIWLVLAQGFSHHVETNAEALRAGLVRHQGRKTLTVETEDLSMAAFQTAIASFSAQIREAIDPVLHETLICDFSTTTPAIRTASEVALMDGFKDFFDYSFRCVCGIPKITLEGTPEDWHRIRSRAEVLSTYDLEWWVSRLRPILDEFVATSEGRPDPEFWKAIYKPVEAYGGGAATGWITDLFPYLGDTRRRRRNHVFQHKRQGWALPIDGGVQSESWFNSPGVGLRGFPSGLCSVPVKVSRDEMSTRLDFVAGFLAVDQDLSDLTLSPMIGWCVAESATSSKPAASDPFAD